MKRDGGIRAGLGIPSLVLILLVLCLAILGVLSLISARADDDMARRHAELLTLTAKADARAQRALAHLDEQMVQAWRSCEEDDAYAQACLKIAGACDAQVVWLDTGRAQLCFDAGVQRSLCVEVERVTWEKAAKMRYIVRKYAVNDDRQDEQTDGLQLIGDASWN